MKIVLNASHYVDDELLPLTLSEEAAAALNALKGMEVDMRDLDRNDPDLIKVVEQYPAPDDPTCIPVIVEIPDDVVAWEIECCNGEYIREVGRQWYPR